MRSPNFRYPQVRSKEERVAKTGSELKELQDLNTKLLEEIRSAQVEIDAGAEMVRTKEVAAQFLEKEVAAKTEVCWGSLAT